MRRRIEWMVLILVVVLAAACSGQKQAKTGKYPSPVSAVMQEQFGVAEGLYKKRRYTQAYQEYERYLETYAYNRLSDEAIYKQAKVHVLRGQHDEAIAKFRSLADKSPDPKYRAKALYFAGYSAFVNKNDEQAVKLFKDVRASDLPIKLRLQFHSLAYLASGRTINDKDFADYNLLKLYELYDESSESLKGVRAQYVMTFEKVQKGIDIWLATPMTSGLPDWFEAFPVGSARTLIDYKTARHYYDNRDEGKAKSALGAFLQNHPRSEFAQEVEKMLASLGVDTEQFVGPRFTLGVIAPLSGDNEKYGNSVWQGVQCAVGDQGACGESTPVQILKEPAGWDRKSLQESFDKLKKAGAAAVVVLVPGKLTFDAIQLSDEMQLPMFLISQQSGLMSQGDYIYQMGLTPEQQIADLVQEAFNRGYRSFSVFYPDILYGDVMRQLFVKEVEGQGGKIVGDVSYSKSSSDAFAQVRKLKKHIQLIGGSTENLGFDALFIPDSFLTVNSLLQGLEYHKIYPIPLLGTNTWHDPQLDGKMAINHPGSFFISSFDPALPSRLVTSFKNSFAKSFEHEPALLSALSYDAAMMIRHVVRVEGLGNIKKALDNKFSFKGVTGIRSFDKGKGPIMQTYVIDVDQSFSQESAEQ